MAQLHVANFYDADRRSAVCHQTGGMALGQVIKITDDGAGARKALLLGNGDAALLVAGNYGVAFKVSTDPNQVPVSTLDADRFGSRVITIASGDDIVELRRGSIIEYPASLLHSSLDPDRSGTLPEVDDKLEIVNALFCAAGTSSAITSPIIARVFRVNIGAKKVSVEII
jgi:hypothetical protein